MNIKYPLCITSRLMAGYRFDDGSTVNIDYSNKTDSRGAPRFKVIIDDGKGQEYETDELACWGGLNEALSSLFCFLNASAEAFQYGDTEDSSFHGTWVPEWANNHLNDIQSLEIELEENTLIEE